MKRGILKSFTMLMLTLALAAVTAQAQSANEMKADIPFRFVIGNQTLPAGEYIIRYVNQDSGKTALLFKSRDGRTNRIVNMMPAQKSEPLEKTSLVFNQYGENCFLSEVWTSGSSYGLALPKSNAERRERELAQNSAKRVTVALIARR